MFNGNSPSLADIAAVTGNNRDDGFFGGEGIWAVIIFAMIFGWGGFGGFGGGFGGANGAMQGYATQADIQRGFDTSNIISKLDGITNGLSDGFYAMNTGLMNGFNGVDRAVCDLGYNVQQGFNTTNIALMQGQNALQTQLADCCCTTQRAIDGVNYNMATNTCALQNTMNNNTRDIIDSQNAGTRAILDYLCQDKISTLQAENQSLKFQASQTAQNQFITQVGSDIVNRLQPVPVPAFPASNLYAYGNGSGCGCNSCC